MEVNKIYYKDIDYADVEFFPEKRGMRISWGIEGWGFGTFDFVVQDGKLCIDDEYMGKETVKLIMDYVIDHARERTK